VTFASAIACLKRDNAEYKDLPTSLVSLLAVTFLLMPRDYRELQYDPWLLIAVFIYVTASVILLMNLLIAQLNCSYEFIYQDMVGFALLKRAATIVDSLSTCSPARWARFAGSLKFDQRIEFNEGDIGIPGAIQMLEPASLNPITTEQIIRYGGTCSPEMSWPEDKDTKDANKSKDGLDRLDRMEVLIRRMYKKLQSQKGESGVGGGSSGEDGMDSESSGEEAVEVAMEKQLSKERQRSAGYDGPERQLSGGSAGAGPGRRQTSKQSLASMTSQDRWYASQGMRNPARQTSR